MRKAVLLNDTRVDNHHGCSTVVDTIHSLAERSGIRITATAPAHANWRLDSSVIGAIDDSDVVIVNGEGTIHHDRPAGEALLAAAEYARRRGKASALVNATWDTNGEAYSKMASMFSLVSVRESSSAKELAAAGVAARVVPDLALYPSSPVASERCGVAFTDSVIGSEALEIYRRMWRLGAEPTSLLFGRKSARDYATSARRFLKGSPFKPGNFLAAARGALTDRLSQNPNRQEILSLIASRELMVTGRFHMVILCLSAGTPFLAVESNTHKISSTLRDTGLASWRLVEPSSLDGPSIVRASRWHGTEKATLDNFVNTSRRLMEELFHDIRRL